MMENLMFELTGKVALITGATGGIGMSIAKKMKLSGAKLILSGTKQNVLNDFHRSQEKELRKTSCSYQRLHTAFHHVPL